MAEAKNFKTRESKIISIIKALSYITMLSISLFMFIFFYFAKDLPRPEKFTEVSFNQPTRIYDRTGQVLLYEIYGEEKRKIIRLDEASKNLINAIIATEDSSFYNHFGIDIKSLGRAILNNIKNRNISQGGSTITQQLIRTTFLTREKTPTRKIREIILTLELERRYSKSQILEWYINQVPLGPNIYGVETASETYFGKKASELTVPESAVIASLIRAPSLLYPYGNNFDKLMERKNYVIDRMREVGFISKEEAEKYKKEIIEFQPRKKNLLAPHFVLYVLDYLQKKYGQEYLQKNGLKVITTLDFDLQSKIEKITKEELEKLKPYNANNASVVVIDPRDGSILAMLGSKDYFGEKYPENCKEGVNCLFDPKVNIATFGIGRQTGSSIKPIYYILALEKGLTPESKLWDVKTEFNPNCPPDASGQKDNSQLPCYHPNNFNNKFKGIVSIRESLAQSLNVPSVKIFYLVGTQNFYAFAQKAGINMSKNIFDAGLSTALGVMEVRLIDLVSAYSVFANNGIKTTTNFIIKVEDNSGNLIEKRKINKRRIISVNSAKMINNILSDNKARTPAFGPNSFLYFKGYDIAGKTGTTQNYEDAWTILYSKNAVLGVWVGNNNHEQMARRPGVVFTGNIAHRIMEELIKKYPPEKFEKPEINLDEDILYKKISFDDGHSILHYINKDNFKEIPSNPEKDPQYKNWEEAIKIYKENITNQP